jgi:hypothetical protein
MEEVGYYQIMPSFFKPLRWSAKVMLETLRFGSEQSGYFLGNRVAKLLEYTG